MSFRTKIQLIRRKSGHEQWYVNFPSACAQMMGFRKGEDAAWEIGKSGELKLRVVRRSGKNKKD